ncbi:MAG: UbiA family prenyltransferase [Planctomycetota bacterium]
MTDRPTFGERARAVAELLRVSNVLTAVADVWMGMIVATGAMPDWRVAAPLTAACVLIYLAGMVLNDAFDAPRDAIERPTRPIPSGRISRTTAAWLGAALMKLGLACGAVAAFVSQASASLLAIAVLCVLVLLYDSRLKATPFGPPVMGLCRGANAAAGLLVMVPLAVAPKSFTPLPPDQAGAIVFGLTMYFMGLTYFARNEAVGGRRPMLLLSIGVSLGGLVQLAAWPLRAEEPGLLITEFRWLVLWAVVAMLVGRRYVAAVLQPSPRTVQAAVGNAITSVIIIDAALAFGYAGQFWGLAIFALLPPTLLMSRFVPQT